MSETATFSNHPSIFEAAERLYRNVDRRLCKLLPRASVHHIGSTAVPGSLTKGDLDVLVQVTCEQFAGADEVIAEHYERNRGSDRTDAFSAFVNTSSTPHLGIQLVVRGSEADVFLQWRDQLRSDTALVLAYDALKRRFEGRKMSEYRNAKSRFIEKYLAR